jgi:hypothetical protein
MKRHWLLRGLMFLPLAILFFAAFGWIVMHLWNWLTPAVFGWHAITYWQALGLLILSKILLGGFRGGSHRPWGWRGRMMDRWEHMSPEEREKFRQGMRGRCGSFGSQATEPKA